jgi:P-type Ca2+ transporter type 2C
MPAIHALTAAEVLARLRVSGVTGLTDEEARARLKSYGPNTIVSRRKVSAVRVLLHQFQSPVVYLLAAAAVLAFYFAEWEEGGAIAIVLTLNALIGFLTELKAALHRGAAHAGLALRARAAGWPCASHCSRANGPRRYRRAGGR